MRIILASAWFPVGVGAYLLRAARRIQKTNPALEVVTVGPTSGAQCWAPEFQYPEHAIYPTYPDGGVILDHAETFKAPDLWVDIDGAYFTDRKMPWPHAIVATDPHIAEQGGTWTYELQREVADFFFCMQKPYCLPGTNAGRRADIHLPYAYDPEVFHPYPDQKMDADVTVLGVPYPKRTLVVEELRRRGFKVLAGMGSVYEEYARDLCRAPVAFIWSLKDDVPCRVFEAAACGRVLVVNQDIQEEILRILPGLRMTVFEPYEDEAGSLEDACRATTIWFDAKTTPRHEVIDGWYARGQDNLKAVAGHTWDARLRQIVKTCLGKEI